MSVRSFLTRDEHVHKCISAKIQIELSESSIVACQCLPQSPLGIQRRNYIMPIRLLPVRGGAQAIVLGSDSISVPVLGADGAEADDSAFFEADVSTGQALVTWLGVDGCGRVFTKGVKVPAVLEAGIQHTLAVGDKVDIEACTLEQLQSKPQSRFTYMVTASKVAASCIPATQPVVQYPATQQAPALEKDLPEQQEQSTAPAQAEEQPAEALDR